MIKMSDLDIHFNVDCRFLKKYKGFIKYGTAGFRTESSFLTHVIYRAGMLAVLRSKVKNATIGIMITASHNPESDNGVKLVDPAGEMLESSWEDIATELANVEDDNLISTIRKIIKEQRIDYNKSANVIVGRDTRKSGVPLLSAAMAGIEVLKGNIKNYGVITTPQLHYMVFCKNVKNHMPKVSDYYTQFSKAFKRVRGTQKDKNKYIAEVQVDAANGVGAIALQNFQQHLEDTLKINIFNAGDGELNFMCGADYVKINQVAPSNTPLESNVRCASIDGDADRVVYFYMDDQKIFHLLDGDRIATLAAIYFKELIEASGLKLQLGLVQTAYANGGSTNYVTHRLKIPVCCVSTGVKYLHNKALDFDIGIYFEANGHGTVVFKDLATQMISDAIENNKYSDDQKLAAQKLLDLASIINQTVGDALSDILLVETILHEKGWSLIQWEQVYKELPNKQLKVQVQDRNVIKTIDAETRTIKPLGLQEKIDETVSKYSRGRAFVRPSGTEDVVRVYAECEHKEEIEKLAVEVSILVHRYAGGVGLEPSLL